MASPPDKDLLLQASPRPSWQAAGALYLFYAAVVLRTLAHEGIRPRLPIYLVLEFAYLLLFTAMLWYPARQPLVRHLYFLLQAILVLWLQMMRLRFDFIIVLYILLCFQTTASAQPRSLDLVNFSCTELCANDDRPGCPPRSCRCTAADDCLNHFSSLCHGNTEH
jgi:hypothetical protein